MEESAEEVVRRGYRVSGRVQGVGFRWWTVPRARSLGLRGSVRNCNDGSVEVLAEGTTAAMARLAEYLTSGPPGSKVETVADLPMTSQALPETFDIIG